MRLAIIGSRKAPKNIAVDILPYVPADATEIVSGGAEGVDKAAEDIAAALSLPLRRFLPNYERYGKRAPLMRNLEIIAYADEVLAFWNASVQANRCGWFLFSRTPWAHPPRQSDRRPQLFPKGWNRKHERRER